MFQVLLDKLSQACQAVDLIMALCLYVGYVHCVCDLSVNNKIVLFKKFHRALKLFHLLIVSQPCSHVVVFVSALHLRQIGYSAKHIVSLIA